MTLALSIADVRNRLPALSKRVLRKGLVVVTHHGRPESVLIGYEELRRALGTKTKGRRPGRCAVVLAAGGRERRRSAVLVEGARRLVRTLGKAGVETIIVVSDSLDLLENAVGMEGSTLIPVVNRNAGFASSLKRALRFIEGGFDSVLVAFASRPRIKRSTVEALFAHYETARQKPAIVSPVHGARRGHPILLSARLIPEALRMDPRWGLASLVRRHEQQIDEIRVSDPGVVTSR